MNSSRSYVSKVESAVKGAVVAQLGRKTLILGRNGAGKSAILNSVEVAGSGRASDVAGRATLAKDADLFMLAPPGADKVWAIARFSGGGAAEWTLEKGKRAKRTGTPIAFPLRDVQDALLGSPETCRKWILQHGAPIDWTTQVIPLVPASLRTRLAGAWGGPELSMPAAERLAFALEGARGRTRESNAEARAARAVTPPPQPPPTDQDIAALEGVIKSWQTQAGRATGLSSLESIRAQLLAARASVETLSTQARAYEREIGTLPASEGSHEIRNACVLVCEALARARATVCVICEGETRPDALSARAGRGRAQIEAAVAAEKRRGDLAFALRETQSSAAMIQREIRRLEGLEQEAAAFAGAEKTDLPDLDQGSAEIRLRALHSVRAGWEASRRAEEKALAAERDAVEWEQLADALSKALGQLVEQARREFEGRVQRYLPRTDLFGLELVDGDREVARVGLRRLLGDTMVLHGALSGAEWARVTAALALATCPESPVPAVICPEERAFDPQTLSGVLEAFSAGVAGMGEEAPQIIVTSPVRPDPVPQGWTVIDVGTKFEAGAGAGAALPSTDIFSNAAATPAPPAPPAPPKRGRGRPARVVVADDPPAQPNGEEPPAGEGGPSSLF
jgi:hypothetical protein